MVHDYDILIAGGGMVGASLGCALAPLGLQVAIVESAEPKRGTPPTYDDRAIALAYGSRRILQAIGVWSHLESLATAIERIHISDRGRFGFAHLDRAEEGVPALGYVVLARELGEALYRRLDETSVTRIAPATVKSLSQDTSGSTVALETPDEIKTLRARMVAAADGTRSGIRETLGIDTLHRSYGQAAVITNVTPHKAHGNVAFERFTEDGPLALLPMPENRCGVVWTWNENEAHRPLAWDDETFLGRLQEAFGFRLGRFLRVGARHSYPLQLLMAKQAIRGRTVLIGNAMHTLHPIAGQGFNLGIRDVAVLADVIRSAMAQGADPGAPETLRQYDHWRRDDQQGLARITDGLARLFGNPLPPVRFGRNLGMVLTDVLPGLRHAIAHQAMGLKGRMPRLARGLPLD